jgi:dipeptidyl aminopeptidase/acylaminoacyl peptidase
MKTTYLLLLSFFLSSTLFAQKEDPTRWTPKDVIHTEYLQGAEFSPDGNMLIWSKRRAVKDKDKFVADLYLTRLNVQEDGKFKTVRLTNSDENDYGAFFSRDGETIYFQSSRDEGNKLWSLSIYGGEPVKVQEFKNGFSRPEWQNDSLLLFTATDGKTWYDQELKKKKDNVIVVEDEEHWNVSKIYAFDTKQKSTRRISDNTFPVNSYAVSKDGKQLVYSTTQSRHYASDGNPKPKHYLHNLETGETKQILQDLHQPRSFQFTTDSKGFYFSTELTNFPKWNGAGIGQLHYYDLAEQSHEKIDLDWAWGMEGGFRVVGNGVLASLANGTTRKLAFYDPKTNWKRQNLELGEHEDHVNVLAMTKAGDKAVYVHSTASQLPEYYVMNVKQEDGLQLSDKETLIKLNSNLRKKPITKSEVIKWKGWQGDEVTGVLYYPENYEEGKRYPLMLSIHGGPSAATLDSWSERWSTYPNILAQRGAFVLKPNYHGSSNHGLEFVESIAGNYYDPEMEDINAGIEYLNERGLIDKSQMGTMGWSNGAILTTMLTVRYPDAFKVACPGAGDVNWTSDYGTCRFGVQFDQHYFGGAPWDDANGKTYNENYITKSPLFELEKVKTPTIIFHGSEDRAVPRDQGWEYYRALQQIDQAPVRFLWFPGQPHGLQKITHQMRKMEEELAWIDEYLLEKKEEKDEALKEDSPLALLMKKEEVKHLNGVYGTFVKGTGLLPEVQAIKADSLAIGIFEVTNAQFRAYDPTFLYQPAESNYPAVVSADQAKAYVKWLSAQTDDTYRLPTEEEGAAWHKKAKSLASSENSLNAWAGYELSLKDARRLQSKLRDKSKQLLKPVGTYKATTMGDAQVYDLGGNVAEYYGEDGKTYGWSAFNFVDAMNSGAMEGTPLTGFRVVRE